MSRVHVSVRPAGPDDIDSVVALVRSTDVGSRVSGGRAVLDASSAHLAERFAQILDDADRTLLIGLDDHGEVCGMLAARADEVGTIDLAPVLHVTHLLVRADHRRRGVGRALLAAAVTVAEQAGVAHVLATVATGSREGNRYLARLGFGPLVVHRLAAVSTLRRSLGMTDPAGRTAVLRRARLVRGSRGALAGRPVRRGP